MAVDVAAPVTNPAVSALARCVGDVEPFIANYWAQRPFLRHADRDMSFDDLLSLTDVDHIVSTTSLRSPAFRLVKAAMAIDVRSYTRYGSVGPQEVYDIADVGRVYDEFHQGATIALQGLQNFWLP